MPASVKVKLNVPPPATWPSNLPSLFGRVPLVYLPHALVAPLEVATYPFRSALQKRLAIADFRRLDTNADGIGDLPGNRTRFVCPADIKAFQQVVVSLDTAYSTKETANAGFNSGAASDRFGL